MPEFSSKKINNSTDREKNKVQVLMRKSPLSPQSVITSTHEYCLLSSVHSFCVDDGRFAMIVQMPTYQYTNAARRQ
jgi:hypothetical protein